MRPFYCLFVFTIVVSPVLGQQTPLSGDSIPSDAEIRKILIDRVDVLHKSTGMVVGIVTPTGRRVVGYGRVGGIDSQSLDGDTVFEIGSVSKIFTALAMADMWRKGEIAPNDPVSRYLPSDVSVPERNGRTITLADLATQTSGLPFFPPNFSQTDQSAFATYSLSQMYSALSTYALGKDPGTSWDYSNWGYGILGDALARKAGVAYATLIKNRITGPLGMTSTGIELSPSMRIRFVSGHDAKLQVTPQWVLPSMEGAGSLRSTANDLLTLLAAFAGITLSPLTPAMTKMLEIQRPGLGFRQALGWWVFETGPNSTFETHEGGTFGYSSTIAYDPAAHIGVVVLSNSATGDGGLAWHLLRPSFPLETSTSAKQLQERKETQVAPKLLSAYVGKYQTEASNSVITIELHDDYLLFKSPDAPQGLELYAESDSQFFIKEADLQVSFQNGPDELPTALVIHFAGTSSTAKRLPDLPR